MIINQFNFERTYHTIKEIKKVMSQHKNKEGFIYLIQAKEINRFKIGKTRSIFRRFKELESQSPVPLRLLYYYPSINMDIDENNLHYGLRRYRKYREWFDLTDKTSQNILYNFLGIGKKNFYFRDKWSYDDNLEYIKYIQYLDIHRGKVYTRKEEYYTTKVSVILTYFLLNSLNKEYELSIDFSKCRENIIYDKYMFHDYWSKKNFESMLLCRYLSKKKEECLQGISKIIVQTIENSIGYNSLDTCLKSIYNLFDYILEKEIVTIIDQNFKIKSYKEFIIKIIEKKWAFKKYKYSNPGIELFLRKLFDYPYSSNFDDGSSISIEEKLKKELSCLS